MIERLNEMQIYAYNNHIDEFVHFTNVKNLLSILERGVLSRQILEQRHIPFAYNDEMRLDGVKEAISLSVTFPNYRMFYKYAMEKLNENWVVITFDAQKILAKKCIFFRTNAACRDSYLHESEGLCTAEAFMDMFSGWDEMHDRREMRLSDNETTNPQAEIMVYNEIALSCINRVVFENEELFSDFRPELARVGIPGNIGKHFFSPRRDYKYWSNVA